jgi:DNA repair protein RadD
VELRGYQQEARGVVVDGVGDTLIQAPTGAGKTIIFSKCLEHFAGNGLRCLVLAHRGELVRQAADKLEKATGIKCGVFSAYLKRKDFASITVASIQSLANCKDELDFDIVIIDECHRVPDKGKGSQYEAVLRKLDARIIGFTATPYRLDSGLIYGEGQWWPRLDFQIPLRQLISEGHLVDYAHKTTVATKKIIKELKQVKTTAGEYNEKQSSELMSQSQNVHSIKNTVQDEKSIVVFCVNIAHAEAIGDILDDYSIVHSRMKADERDENLRRFDAGETRWMLNVGVLTEGWDCTRVDCIVLARPTKSTALYVQMVGRGLRLHPGKQKCIIYDIVGNYHQFGFVDDPMIVTDEGRGEGEAKPKVCLECFSVVPANAKTCPDCGFEFVKEEEPVELDEEDDAYVMAEQSIDEHPNFGDVTGGFAQFYEGSKGTNCLKVGYYHSKRKRPIYHFYPIEQKWIGSKLAKIAKRGRPQFKEDYLTPKRFMNAVNGSHIFPIKGVMIQKDGDFEKISTF